MFYDSDLSPKTKQMYKSSPAAQIFSFATEEHLKAFQSGKGRPTSALQRHVTATYGANRSKGFPEEKCGNLDQLAAKIHLWVKYSLAQVIPYFVTSAYSATDNLQSFTVADLASIVVDLLSFQRSSRSHRHTAVGKKNMDERLRVWV